MDKEYPIIIKRFRTSKSIRLFVRNRQIKVTAPYFVLKKDILSFVVKHKDWIESEFAKEKSTSHILRHGTHKDFIENKQKAKELCETLLTHYNKYYNAHYNAVTIRNQISRWGSCSTQHNLSFNWRIILLPEHLAHYLVVHELCHCIEHNHSKSFWGLVEKTIPDYKKRSKELRGM